MKTVESIRVKHYTPLIMQAIGDGESEATILRRFGTWNQGLITKLITELNSITKSVKLKLTAKQLEGIENYLLENGIYAPDSEERLSGITVELKEHDSRKQVVIYTKQVEALHEARRRITEKQIERRKQAEYLPLSMENTKLINRIAYGDVLSPINDSILIKHKQAIRRTDIVKLMGEGFSHIYVERLRA